MIAATNRDLQRAVGKGSLRQDLYYRLSVFPLRVPPLRERAEDIPLLVHYFVGRHAARIGRRISRVPKAAMERLVAYPWPGNVRELENVIERAVILSPGPDLEVAAEALPAPLELADDSGRAHQADEPRPARASVHAPIDRHANPRGHRPHPHRRGPPAYRLEDRRHRWRGTPSQVAPEHSAQPDKEAWHPAQRQQHFVDPLSIAAVVRGSVADASGVRLSQPLIREPCNRFRDESGSDLALANLVQANLRRERTQPPQTSCETRASAAASKSIEEEQFDAFSETRTTSRLRRFVQRKSLLQ